jgi:hypothetical protein
MGGQSASSNISTSVGVGEGGIDVEMLVGRGSTVSLGILVGRGEVAVGDEGMAEGSSSTTPDGRPQAISESNRNMTRKMYLLDAVIGISIMGWLNQRLRGLSYIMGTGARRSAAHFEPCRPGALVL